MTSIVDSTKEKNFSKYGQKFQLALLSLLVQDKIFANKIKPILQPSYFDNKYTQWFCEQIITQIDEYRTPPTFEDLKAIVESQIPKGAQIYYVTLQSIEDADLDRQEFVEKEAEKFCFTKYALQQLDEERNRILLGDFEMARQTAFGKYKIINKDSKDVDIKADYEQIMTETNRHPIPTPLESVNKITKDGPGAGNLVVIVAQSNFGKTQYAIATARHAAKLGKKVLFFSLETDNLQLMQRFLAGYTNIPQELLKNNPAILKERLSNLKGEFRLVEYKATQARVDALKLKLEELKAEGFFPDMIVVDGLNQLKLPKGITMSNSNDKFEYLAEELRDWSKELEVPLYTCFQANRGGFNVEYADEQNIGKAIEVYQVCDMMLLFTQTPQMFEQSECYVQVLKNRLGPKGLMLKLSYDPNLGTFTELESVSRSMLFDASQRKNITKGLDLIGDRLAKSKQA